jgi:predicted acetyltransferase
MELVRPTLEHVQSYLDARERGFSFDFRRDPESIAAETQRIKDDPEAYLAGVEDLDPVGRTVPQPDGTEVPRLPQYTRWMWDGEFAGIITFRWQRGTPDLPPTCHGHIGYAVVAWKRRLGYATQALHDILELPRREGLPFVDITTAPDNIGSQQVMLNNGALFIDQYSHLHDPAHDVLNRYRIFLG